MSSKNIIDNKVRQEIANGEEPHNLGAWANMERMLDGKNPYQEQEEKKRRPWLFMFLGFLICSTAVVGGYNYFSNTQQNNNKTAIAHSPSNSQSNNVDAIEKANNTNESVEASQESNTIASNDADISSALASSSTQSSVAAISQAAVKQSINQIGQYSESSLVNSSSNNSQSSFNKKKVRNQISQAITSNSNINNQQEQVFANNENLNSTKEVLNKVKNSSLNPVAKSTTKISEQITPTIKERYLDTTQVTEISQRIQKDAMGNKELVADSFQYSIVKEKQRTIINPRFVALTREQEEAAQRRTAIASTATNVVATSPTQIIEPTPKSMTAIKAEPALATNTTNEKKAKSSFFSLFKRAGASIRQKGISMAHTRTPIYTGMFLGVNAALVNSKHNFGGFQGGLTAMTPLGRLLTLQTEARIINQNNSGYTVTDNKSIIRSTFIDSTTLTHAKIYNYEVDSVGYSYNLKDFYTLQVPILVNANFKKFNIYAGVHFNYGFRMNINTNSSSNPVSIVDTAFGTAYTMRTNSTPKFTRDDFSDRMGLGYTVGGGYNFTSRINLDLRMSNLFWDNTKAAKQEISNTFFKIPNFQLSLGYKFRSFEIEE